MLGFNQVTLIGYVGKEPEMNYTPAGKAVTKFSVGVSEYKGKDKQNKPQYETQWFNIVAWDALAETANRVLYKGAPAFIQGRINQRTYTGKDNLQHNTLEVIASTLNLLAKSPQAADESASDSDTPF